MRPPSLPDPRLPLGPQDGPQPLAPVRDVTQISVARTGRVVETGLEGLPYMVDADPVVEPLFAHYLVGVVAGGAAPLTVRKYAYGCLVLYRYALAFGVDLALWSRVEVRDMVRHLQCAENPQRRRGPRTQTPMPGTLVMATGKRYLPEGYSARYINGLLVPMHGFFEWYGEHGGPVLNPVPAGAGRDPLDRSVNAGRGPDQPFRRPGRRGLYRQPEPEWLPRRMSSESLAALRADLRSARDEAMFQALEDSGIRTNELVTLTDRNLDPVAGTARVVGKGLRGGTREVPFSPRAFELVERSREELQRRHRVRLRTDDPLFWTLGRRDPRPLTYQSVRGWWRALNARHGLNHSLHDMRHTAAFRMIESGHLKLHQVQEILGHRHLTTTQLYIRPTTAEVVAAAAEWWNDQDRYRSSGLDLTAVAHLDEDDLREVFGDLL